jgi:hypothetical protein
MRKLVVVIAPPLVGLLAWLFLSWPELPEGAQARGAQSASAADQREAEGPQDVLVSDDASAGTPEKPQPQASQDPRPSNANVAPPPSAAVEASDPDAARPSAAPGTRLAELQRRALAGEPKAMRDWLDALEQCGKVFAPPHHPDAARYVDLLSEDWAARWQQYALPLLAPMTEDCRALFPEQDQRRLWERWRALRTEAIAALVAVGDPLAQLVQDHLQVRGLPTPEQWARRQALALATLDPTNPQSLVELGRTARYLSRFDTEAAWHLVACDLGLDCSADGALMRQNCLSQGLCPEVDYESALLRLMPPRQWSRVQAQRQVLREAIARGELATLFDRPPPRPPGGG